jgi:hypothetical protein
LSFSTVQQSYQKSDSSNNQKIVSPLSNCKSLKTEQPKATSTNENSLGRVQNENHKESSISNHLISPVSNLNETVPLSLPNLCNNTQCSKNSFNSRKKRTLPATITGSNVQTTK